MTPIRIRYRSIAYRDFDLHVRTLWDGQQFSDDDGVAEALGISSAAWPIFGTLWPAGRTLARMMAVHGVDGLQILEVGCGIGLSSLVLNHRRADITATDHHPEARAFLDANTALNGDPLVPFVRAAWTDRPAALGQFDLIVGADLLYDHHQVSHLAEFIGRHLRPDGQVILTDPGRKPRARFNRRMVDLGFSCTERRAEPSEVCDEDKGVRVLSYRRDPADPEGSPRDAGASGDPGP